MSIRLSASDLELRPADGKDAAFLAEVYNIHIRAGRSTMDTVLKDEEYFEQYLSGMEEREGVYVLQTKDEKRLGYGLIKKYSDRPGYRVACEMSIYLLPEEINKGFGTFVMRALIQQCRKFYYRHIVAKVWAANEESIALCRKCGFEMVGVQKEVGYVKGRWINVAIMQLVFRDAAPNAPEL